MATPVILDTDIGFDVDDVWALVFLLQCPELDVKLITTTTGDTWYRAAIVAKLLTIAGRTDIPIGIGIPLDYSAPTHEAWLGDFQLSEYAGVVIEDGIGALCKTIHDSHEPVSLIGIGPLPNIAAALSRSPILRVMRALLGCMAACVGGIWARRSQCENITSSSMRCRLAPCFKRPGKKSLRRWIPAASLR